MKNKIKQLLKKLISLYTIKVLRKLYKKDEIENDCKSNPITMRCDAPQQKVDAN